MSSFYKKLFKLKKDNQALWNGNYGGGIEIISSTRDSLGFSFIRNKEGNKVISIFNLSQENIQIELNSENLKGTYTSFFTGDEKVFQENENIDLYPWEFQIYSNKK